MSDLEKLHVIINILNAGRSEGEFYKSGSTITIQRIQESLPIKTRGIKRGSRFVVPIEVTSRKENIRQTFSRGDISVNAQTSEVSIHLEENNNLEENYLGRLTGDLNFLNKIRLTHGVSITKS